LPREAENARDEHNEMSPGHALVDNRGSIRGTEQKLRRKAYENLNSRTAKGKQQSARAMAETAKVAFGAKHNVVRYCAQV
jgi:hypothetical protein